jgi:hypothetical protein
MMRFRTLDNISFDQVARGPVIEVADSWDRGAVEKPLHLRRIRLMFGMCELEGTVAEFEQAFDSYQEVRNGLEKDRINWQIAKAGVSLPIM